jgi:predicted  nucleic acid-binding Zn-ribbon protein
VTHAFAMNALLQWPITFYSDETVVARWKADRDRYPPYIKKIDRAVDRGETVAIVGYVGYTYGLERLVSNPDAIVNIDGKYFIYVGADKDLLRRAGFEFR